MNTIKYTREKQKGQTLFSKRDQAYMADPAQFSDFMAHQPKLSSFHHAIDEKAAKYDDATRAIATAVLREQFDALAIQEAAVSKSIAALAETNTFAIITAHQPCLMTGPLYFIYKIASAISLAQAVEAQYPEHRIIPLYVVGSEDHDFDEINHIRLFQKEIEWLTDQSGAVGRMKLKGIEDVIEQISPKLDGQTHSQDLLSKLKLSYNPDRSLAEATAHFVYSLFGRFGLVVMDMDDPRLKQLAAPMFEKELNEQFSKPLVLANQSGLEKLGFNAQIHARNINLFHLDETSRTRMTLEEMKPEEHHELSLSNLRHISPNVVLRPLYQQTVLPGIAYVGGGAEVAYWMEIKGVFDEMNLPFPVLVRRDSALWIKPYTADLMQKVNFSAEDLFMEVHEAQEQYLKNHADDDWTLDKIKNAFDVTYDALFQEIEQIDSGLVNMARGFQSQHHNFISKAEAKLKKSLKTKHDVSMNRITKIWDDLFPGGSLQERKDSFLSIYNRLGPAFIDELILRFDPLDTGLHIFQEGSSE